MISKRTRDQNKFFETVDELLSDEHKRTQMKSQGNISTQQLPFMANILHVPKMLATYIERAARTKAAREAAEAVAQAASAAEAQRILDFTEGELRTSQWTR